MIPTLNIAMLAAMLGQPAAADGVAAVQPPAALEARVAGRNAVSRTTLKAAHVQPTRLELPATEPIPVANPVAGAESRPAQVGYVRPVPGQLAAAWPWQPLAGGGWIARTEFHSAKATGLRLKFRGLTRRSGIEMRVYDPAGTAVFGPFRAPRTDEQGGWLAPTIFGETIGIELYSPADALPAPGLQITDVIYIGCRCHSGAPGDAAQSCENHIACFSSWQNNDGRGVVMIFFLSGTCCSACSASIWNRQPGDFSPLVLTANHCISTQGKANSLETFWLWEAASCSSPTTPTFNNLPRNDGALLLKRQSTSDFTMLGLFDPPASGATPLYLGWNSAAWNNNESATGVHHPNSALKRISFGTTGGTSNRTFTPGTSCGVNHSVDVRKVSWTDGVTEGGSSGSPIFDSNRQVRGVLTGGGSSCPSGGNDDDDFYGRFDLAYDNLKYFLGNSWIASPVYVDNGVAGDAGNNGNAEQGTSGAPFNTIFEATYAVRSSDEVRVEPGTYNEQFRVWRPMTLKRKGTTGSVRIGG